MKNKTHTQFVAQCIQYLLFLEHNEKPVYATKTHTYSGKILNGRHLKTGRIGLPDISTTINGKSVYYEAKVGNDTQSEEQIIAQKQIENAGGYYYIVRSIKNLKQITEKHLKNV